MKTIERHDQIDEITAAIKINAEVALSKGLKFTVEWRDNGITEKQFKALHVWCQQCAEHLNSVGAWRYSPATGKTMRWNKQHFKDDIYKPVLRALTKKKSTKDQSTIDPDEIRLAIAGHLAQYRGVDVVLPDWPSWFNQEDEKQ